jgi:hypothetical protein
MTTVFAHHAVAVVIAAALAGASLVAVAQTAPVIPKGNAPTNSDLQLIDPPVPGAAPKTYALVSAAGSTLNMVSARYQTGSNIDPFNRRQIDVGSQALNNVVLVGLDKAVERIDPSAKRVLVGVSSPDLVSVTHNKRADAAAQDMLNKLQAFDERKQWDYIIAVTPRYQHSGFNRMGDKLWGIGVYVHELESANMSGSGMDLPVDMETFAPVEEEMATPTAGVRAKSNKFLAPYAYLRFTVYDAKTLQVLRVLDRLDARKTVNPDCDALKMSDCFSNSQLMAMVVAQTERSVSAGVTGKTGIVEVKDAKIVSPAQPAASR